LEVPDRQPPGRAGRGAVRAEARALRGRGGRDPLEEAGRGGVPHRERADQRHKDRRHPAREVAGDAARVVGRGHTGPGRGEGLEDDGVLLGRGPLQPAVRLPHHRRGRPGADQGPGRAGRRAARRHRPAVRAARQGDRRHGAAGAAGPGRPAVLRLHGLRLHALRRPQDDAAQRVEELREALRVLHRLAHRAQVPLHVGRPLVRGISGPARAAPAC
jgi:hypothetical protein